MNKLLSRRRLFPSRGLPVWRDLPLVSKLSILFVVLAVLPLVSVTLYNEFSARSALLSATRIQNWQRARGTAEILDAYLAEVLTDIQVLAIAPDTVYYLRRRESEIAGVDMKQLLNQELQAHGYDVLYVTDSTGIVLLATDQGLESSNYFTARWFLSAKAGQVVFDEPRYDPTVGQVFLHFSAPIRSPEGIILGTVIGRISPTYIDRLIAADANYSNRDDFGVLWDDRGIRLSHASSPELRFRPFAPLSSDVLDELIADGQYGPETGNLLAYPGRNPEVVEQSRWLLYNHDANPYLGFELEGTGPVQAAIVPLHNKRWLYAVVTPEKAILAALNTQTRRGLEVAAGVSLTAVCVAIFVARWVTRPIRAVSAAVSAITSGDMTSRVGLKQRDEVGQLAAGFDGMAAALMEKEIQLRHYASDLELRVQERTEELRLRIENLRSLRIIDTTITANTDVNLTLNIVLIETTTQLHLDAADILLFNPYTLLLEYAAGTGFRSNAIQYTRLQLGKGYAGKAALERTIVHIPNLMEADSNLPRALDAANEAFSIYYGVPLIAKGQIKGVLEVYHRTPLELSPERIDFLETLARQAAIAIDNATLFENLQRSNIELILAYDATIEGWSQAMSLRDKETEIHSQRVTELTLKIARAMGMNDADLVHLRRGALLHDIGKLGVPDNILLKPDKLTDEEWAIMRRHPQYAYDMLAHIEYLRPAIDIPYCHHEKWDGTGYPRGLKGEQIPLGARIFAVVDVYDALLSDRPYRKAWSDDRILAYMYEQSGKHFDPEVVRVFLEIWMPGSSA